MAVKAVVYEAKVPAHCSGRTHPKCSGKTVKGEQALKISSWRGQIIVCHHCFPKTITDIGLLVKELGPGGKKKESS